MSGSLYWRLILRDLADTFDAVVLSSLGTDTNPYLAGPPEGDGESVDPLTGRVALAAYVIPVVDATGTITIDAALNTTTGRVITGLLADATGRWSALNRKATLQESTNGTDWTTVYAGYVTRVSLVSGIEYALHIGDSDRRERRVEALRSLPSGSGWSGMTVIGKPFSQAPTPGPAAWRFKVAATTDTNGDLPAETVVLEFVEGYMPDGLDGPIVRVTGEIPEDVHAQINAAVEPLAVKGSDGTWTFPSLTATVTLPDGTSVGTFTPWGLLDIFLEVRPGDGTDLVGRITDKYIALQFGATSLPADDTLYDVIVTGGAASEYSPYWFQGHIVDLVTTLFTEHGIAYDTTTAASVKAALGSRFVEYRFTEPENLWGLLERAAFGPGGFAPRKNTDNEWEFFLSRTIPTGSPSDTIAEAQVTREGAPFDLDIDSQITSVTYKLKHFHVGGDTSSDAPLDRVAIQTVTLHYVGDPDDTEEAGDHTLVYDLPGVMYSDGVWPPISGVNLLESDAREIVRRWGRGNPSSELHTLRASGIDLKVGDFVTVDLAHKPGIDTGETLAGQRGEARICQVVQRTLTPGGPIYQALDVGSSTTNALVPAFTLAQGTDTYHQSTLTLTNHGDLAGYKLRIQVNIGSTEPSGGTMMDLITPSASAVNLPTFAAGSKVWARARVEKDDELPGAWSSWSSVALDALPAVTGLANAAGANDTERLITWTVGDADLPVRIRWKLTADGEYTVSVTLPPGSSQYLVTGLVPGSAYTVAVDHLDLSPFVGDSADETTTWTAGSTTPTLNPPFNPAGHTDGAGNCGIEVTAYQAELPSRSEAQMAVETSAGSGTFGSFTTLGSVESVAGGRTRYTTAVANDGLLRRFRMRHTKTGFTASAYTTTVDVDPWGSVTAPPDPSSGATETTDTAPLWVGGLGEDHELVDIGAGRLALQYSLDGSTDWSFFDETDGDDEGPYVSLEVAGNVKGAWFELDDVAADEVAIRVVTVDESATVAALFPNAVLWKYMGGVKRIRIGAYVASAGSFSNDPVIGSVWMETASFGDVVEPPPDPDPPDGVTDGSDFYPVSRALLTWIICDKGTFEVVAGNKDEVDLLTDLSGNSNHLGTGDATVSGARVTRGETATDTPIPPLNGRPPVSFQDAWLPWPTGMFDGVTAGEMFLVVKGNNGDPTALHDRFASWTLGPSTGGEWAEGVGAADSGRIVEDFGSATWRDLGDAPGSLAGWRIYNVRAAAGQFVAALDGAVFYSNGTNTVSWSANPRMGNRGAATVGNSQILVAEIAIHSAILTSEERALVVAELLERWAI